MSNWGLYYGAMINPLAFARLSIVDPPDISRRLRAGLISADMKIAVKHKNANDCKPGVNVHELMRASRKRNREGWGWRMKIYEGDMVKLEDHRAEIEAYDAYVDELNSQIDSLMARDGARLLAMMFHVRLVFTLGLIMCACMVFVNSDVFAMWFSVLMIITWIIAEILWRKFIVPILKKYGVLEADNERE